MGLRRGAFVGAADLGLELETLAHEVIGAGIEVHRELGPGFQESVYETALCLELTSRGIAVSRQVPVTIFYKGHPVGDSRIDVLVQDRLLVELKAVEAVHPLFIAQTISYLRAKRLRLGLLMNFNVPVLKDGIKRVVV